nr:hypothetical protein [Clostridia bacterium]
MDNQKKSKKKNIGGLELFKSALYNYIYPTCAFFTVAVFVTNLVGTLAKQSQIVPTVSFMALLLFFSFCIAAVNRVFASKLNPVIKFTIHFIGCTAAFALVFVVFSGYYKNSSSAVFIMFFFILCYLIVMAAAAMIKNLLFRKKIEESPYKKQF